MKAKFVLEHVDDIRQFVDENDTPTNKEDMLSNTKTHQSQLGFENMKFQNKTHVFMNV